MRLGELDVVVSWEVPQETRASTTKGKDGLIGIAAHHHEIRLWGQFADELARSGIEQLRIIDNNGVEGVLAQKLGALENRGNQFRRGIGMGAGKELHAFVLAQEFTRRGPHGAAVLGTEAL